MGSTDAASTPFGRRLLQARLDRAASLGRPISKAEVGRALGVTGVTVGRWERGEKEPNLDTVRRLADFLGVSPAHLAFGDVERATGVALPPPLEAPTEAEIAAAYARRERHGGTADPSTARGARAAGGG